MNTYIKLLEQKVMKRKSFDEVVFHLKNGSKLSVIFDLKNTTSTNDYKYY